MAHKTLIIGDSGTGKSSSMRNFSEDEVFVINCTGKALPFRKKFESITPRFEKLTQDVLKAMDSTTKKIIVIDDAQYIMSFQYMRRIKENSWDKWNDIQGDFFNIIKHVDDLPADVTVYFLSHLQRDDEGHEKIKTMGKMLDEKITIEGLFTIVLKTCVKDGQYFFLTQNSGLDTVKSPIGMFDSYAIDNDLKYVDEKIRNYYEIGDFKTDEEVKELDAASAKPEVEKPASKQRRRKERNDKNQEEVNKETPAEEKKEETAAEEWTGAKQAFERAKRRRKQSDAAPDSAGEAEGSGSEESAPEPAKRVRRRRRTTDADGFMNIPEDATDEVPFA